MKTIVFVTLLLIPTVFYAQYEMPKSKKLGETDGLPTLNITECYTKLPAGLKKLESLDEAWSELKENKYMVENAYVGNPKKLKCAKLYGLDVERIEVFTNTGEQKVGEEWKECIRINSIAVFVAEPIDMIQMNEFYKQLKEEYAPMIDAIGIDDWGYERWQWHSTNECGAMMSVPIIHNLAWFAEFRLAQFEIRFTQSCGG